MYAVFFAISIIFSAVLLANPIFFVSLPPTNKNSNLIKRKEYAIKAQDCVK